MASPTRRAELVAQWPTALIAIALFVGLYFVQEVQLRAVPLSGRDLQHRRGLHDLRRVLERAPVSRQCLLPVHRHRLPLSWRCWTCSTRSRSATIHVFPGYGTNLGIQLWVIARFLQSLSLIAALSFMRWRISAGYLFAAYAGRPGGGLGQHFLVGHLSRLLRRRCRADAVQDRLRVRHLRPVPDRPRVAGVASRGIRPGRVSAAGRIDRADDRVGTRLHAVPECRRARRTSWGIT